MAKSKPIEQSDSPAGSAKEDTALVVRAVMDITGCGEPAARERVKGMAPDLVGTIAQLERGDKRIEIVTLLYS